MSRANLALVLAAAAAGGCAAPGGSDAPRAERPAAINHVVLFKLHDPSLAPELLADCDRLLPGIPGVVSYFAGRHVDTGRATVETGYDAAIYVGFNSREDYAGYVVHPDHAALVNAWRPRLEWLRVYDVLDETP